MVRKRICDFDLVVCKNIRSMRKMLGMTQQMVADKLNITSQQLHKYEAGFDRISINVMQKLSNIFGCDIADLLPKQQEQKQANFLKVAEEKKTISFNNTTDNLNVEALELLNMFFSLKKDRQLILLKKVRDFIKED